MSRDRLLAAIRSPRYERDRPEWTYLEQHGNRLARTAEILGPHLGASTRVLDLGSHGLLAPALRQAFGVTELTCADRPDPGCPDNDAFELPATADGTVHSFRMRHFDFNERFPLADDGFDLVIFTEVLEHLRADPFFTLTEIRRVLATRGILVLSVPNCASAASLLRLLAQRNPYVYSAYDPSSTAPEQRHQREYTPRELASLVRAAGFEVAWMDTEDFTHRSAPLRLTGALLRPLDLVTRRELGARSRPRSLRGETTFAVAIKAEHPPSRRPGFLYDSPRTER